jgi:hypothetical protein
MKKHGIRPFTSAAWLVAVGLLLTSLACSDAQKEQLENRAKTTAARVLNPERACVERLGNQRKALKKNRDVLFPDPTPPKTPEDAATALRTSSLNMASFADILDKIDVTECPADIKLAHVATGNAFRTVAGVIQKSTDSLAQPSRDSFSRLEAAWVAEDKLIAQYLAH